MARIYAAFKCDCCGILTEGECDEGALFLVKGNTHYPLSARDDELYKFDDICEPCRDAFRRIIENTAIARGWKRPGPEVVVEAPPLAPEIVHAVDEKEEDFNRG